VYARLSRFAGMPPERIEQTVKAFEDDHLPMLEQTEGFRGILVGVDWNAGKAAAISFWESRAALEASDRAANQARDAAVDSAEPDREPIVDRYEVVLQREVQPR
jgi:heme-degrading monooxygenase HmoA